MKKFLRPTSFITLLPLASVLLTACTITDNTGQTGTTPEWKTHEQQVKALAQYETRGAFAYLTDSQKLYARFYWQQQNPEQYRLVLTNPLGNTVMELNVQPGMVQLVDDKGQRYVSDNAEKMIHQLTGMTIPLENMRQWMIGLPANAEDFTLTPEGRLKKITLEQNGQQWTVEYRNYDTEAQPVLPSLVEITHGDERIKLKMDNWTRQ